MEPDCPDCDGKGWRRTDKAPGSMEANTAKCETCNGFGKVSRRCTQASDERLGWCKKPRGHTGLHSA